MAGNVPSACDKDIAVGEDGNRVRPAIGVDRGGETALKRYIARRRWRDAKILRDKHQVGEGHRPIVIKVASREVKIIWRFAEILRRHDKIGETYSVAQKRV